MDIDGAIQAVANRKLRLLNYARGQGDRVDSGVSGGHFLWAEFAKLQAAFDGSAALVCAMVASGKAEAALVLLNSPDSELNRSSFRMVGLLMDLEERQDSGERGPPAPMRYSA